MSATTAEMSRVGRKKKETPSDYVAVKVPRDVYLNAKIVAALEGRDIAQALGDAARDNLARRASELFNAANPTQRPKGGRN